MMRELLRFAQVSFLKNESRLRASGGFSLFSEEFFVRALRLAHPGDFRHSKPP